MKVISYINILVFSLFLLSCGKNDLDIDSFYKWQNNLDNGLHKTKRIGDLEFDIKYMPQEYLVYMESKGSELKTKEELDSVREFYKNNLTFLLTIGPASDAIDKFDITTVGVVNYDEFDERARTLNFGMKQSIRITSNGQEWNPVICEMENVYGLAYHRKFNIVFTPKNKLDELKQIDIIKLTIDDEIFGSGKTSFIFNKKELTEIPKIKSYYK